MIGTAPRRGRPRWLAVVVALTIAALALTGCGHAKKIPPEQQAAQAYLSALGAADAAAAGGHTTDAGAASAAISKSVGGLGEEGHEWNGVPTLLLTTKGRKSGKLRRTALIYGKSGSSYLVVASQGGAENHPAWYLNLTENPEVAVQVGAEDLVAMARTADASEKPELWKTMTQIWPAYEEYQAKTDRPIPVVVLDPVQLGAS